MIAILQRVSEASVSIAGQQHSQIDQGLLVLVGIEEVDSQEDIDWLSRKILQMRLFNDDQGVMNLSLQDIGGQLLVVSQFTLHASTKKGNRPSYIKAARPETAIPLYEAFVKALAGSGLKVQTGVFGADMQVALINDGPVTIVIDSQNKH